MTDRELLELAAKAYWGDEIDNVVSIEWSEQDNGILYTHGDNQDHNGCDRTYRWNPLEEDADTFQLASKLQLSIGYVGIPVASLVWASKGIETATESLDSDKALNRAIVKVAAAIGEKMP